MLKCSDSQPGARCPNQATGARDPDLTVYSEVREPGEGRAKKQKMEYCEEQEVHPGQCSSQGTYKNDHVYWGKWRRLVMAIQPVVSGQVGFSQLPGGLRRW